MKIIRLFIIILGLFTASIAFSQISHGGTPYYLQPSVLRASSSNFFIEMPFFNLDSVLREDIVNKGNMRGSYKFAHKFYTNININDGVKTVLPDGTTIKQIGINSSGAYSINLLLNDFELPPGGKLFIYNADRSYVVGSFDFRNNSPDKVLPIQPVAGESIIIEYSEPANVPFKANFTITEVNHDYRDFFRREPGADNITDFACMPDVFCNSCESVDSEIIRATVLLMLNGSIACTGSLINNTSDDGKPYLLTGNHCLCSTPSQPEDSVNYYNEVAKTIIAFFNYNRPVCDVNIKMKGSEEMSIAGTIPRVIFAKKDIALLEFKDSIPDYFNPYYAGWNRDLTGGKKKYINLHHPSGAVKKYGMTDGNVKLYSNSSLLGMDSIDAKSLWEVPYWSTGSTYSGSSGSPLFDDNNYIIGGLTGGSSSCQGIAPDTCRGTSRGNKADYFFSLGSGWETGNTENQLKTYLDPINLGKGQYKGKDPNKENPIKRLANAQYTKSDLLITSKFDSPNEGFVFGNSNLNTLEFAEEFTVENPVEIFGAFLMIPAMTYINTSDVKISVYTGDYSPEKKEDSTLFIPRYLNYSYSSGFYQANKNLNIAPTETFVLFNNPIPVNKKFFISYSIKNSSSAQFCVYNTKFSDETSKNTAWIKDEIIGWIPAEKYELFMKKTSLAIQPLVRNKKNEQIEIVQVPNNTNFYYNRSERLLKINEALNKPGQIVIYSVSGQLLEKISVPSGQIAFTLKQQQKGTIGIVKLSNEYFYSTGKIIY